TINTTRNNSAGTHTIATNQDNHILQNGNQQGLNNMNTTMNTSLAPIT
ncbi:unnamed protein product, partial [Rotaria sp. Silwood1]